MQRKTTQNPFRNGNAHFERNNYYFGKMMTVRDFTDEQNYLNEKRWLLNRRGMGWGVLCGLKVRPHDDPNAHNKVIVEPGFALDIYGHEVMVCREHEVDLLTAKDECPPENEHEYYVSLIYEECDTEKRPVPIEGCGEFQEDCVHNRRRETYRLGVTRQKPVFGSVLEELQGQLPCATERFRFLKNPSPVISAGCRERPECTEILLACVCYNPATSTTPLDIDMSQENRKLAFSNEILYELLWSLQEEVWQNRGAHLDRRRHVPLLASTIKGLSYADGKKKEFELGVYPYRLTSDGDHIWITDRESDRESEDKPIWQIWRINRNTLEPMGAATDATNQSSKKYSGEPQLKLDSPGWGIAYDGRQFMWITHHDAQEGSEGELFGTLTRINVCTLERWTLSGLLNCDNLAGCQKFPETAGAENIELFKPYPGEIVLHDGLIYVAHAQEKETDSSSKMHQRNQEEKGASGKEGINSNGAKELFLSRIDPVRGCLIKEVIGIPESPGYEPCSEIIAMASDGDALWMAYQVETAGRKKAIVRKMEVTNEGPQFSEPVDLKGEKPEHIVFDGTRLWVSHNDGVSIIDVGTGEEDETINTKTWHTAMTYGGGEYVWAVVPGRNEAQIHWINILSEESDQWLELLENEDFEISDMQFDGTHIYVAYHVIENNVKKGRIHRLLP